MTPRVASNLKLHEDDGLVPPVRQRRFASVHPRPRARPPREVPVENVDARGSAALLSREAIHRRLLGAADIMAASFALVLALTQYRAHNIVPAVVAGVILVVLLFKVSGLYDRDDLRLVHTTLDEIPLLVQLTGLFALGIAVLQSVTLASTLRADQIAGLWLLAFGAIFVGRVVARAVAGRTSPTERCLVIGENARVEQIRQKLAASRARAIVVASLPIVSEHIEEMDWVDMPKLLRRVVHSLNVHRIIVAPTTTDTTDVVNLIRSAKAVGVRVSVLPRMFEVVGSAVEFDDIDGMTMLGVRRFGLSRSSRVLKRVFDTAVSGVILLLISPIFLAIAVAIRLESRGPMFFRQVRVGRHGRHFWIYKFRSMVADADARKDELRAFNEVGEGLFKITDDPRVTKVGRLLRRTSLDELPQLLNVIRGEMSLVGPRPLVVDEDAQVLGLDRSRLHLTPGMTGPWQILGSRVPMKEMVGIDYLYVANWSLWTDLKLLIRTARHVARRGNV
jgi:exopolysaccharide biosynthesis polyprenyl glycosylphosphotransferase